MFKKANSNIVIAICTGCAMVLFAFYERYGASSNIAVASYIVSALICLFPVGYALLRSRARSKFPK